MTILQPLARLASKVSNNAVVRLLVVCLSIVVMVVVVVSLTHDKWRDRPTLRYAFSAMHKEAAPTMKLVETELINKGAVQPHDGLGPQPAIDFLAVLSGGQIVVHSEEYELVIVFTPTVSKDTVTWYCTANQSRSLPTWCRTGLVE